MKNYPDHRASKAAREMCVEHMADLNRVLLEISAQQHGKVDMFVLGNWDVR